jgi:hypothetical protein
LPGFHAKWLDNNHALIRTLTGIDNLGLASRPTRVHFTYLDPEHRARGGRIHQSITIGDLVEPAYEPELIIILENKDTAVCFPPVPKEYQSKASGRRPPERSRSYPGSKNALWSSTGEISTPQD